MDNARFQELVLQQLQVLTKGQAMIENRMDRLESQISKLKILPTERLQKRRKPGYQPYYNTEAMMAYCHSTGIHPADLTGEEMNQFRLRERITHSNERSSDRGKDS